MWYPITEVKYPAFSKAGCLDNLEDKSLNSYEQEINRRRTFAIISHPDAGKTTLTEKFLLYGGAINLAGSVKGKATARHAVSDWMEIEKEREFPLPLQCFNLNMTGFVLISWIHRDIRISRRILTGH